MTLRAQRLILVFALLGLAASVSSSYVHYRMLRDPSYTSFCDVSETVSCQAVYESRFAAIRGVPVAVLGAIWFVSALLLTASAGPRNGVRRGNVSAYLFILSTAALAMVLYLAYASFFLLKAVCILCVLTYVAVIGIFLVSGSSGEVPMRSVPKRAAADLRLLARTPPALVVLLLFLAGAASAVAFFPREGELATPLAAAESAPARDGAAPTQAPGPSEFERYWAGLSRVPITVPSEGATVVIVKFNDYQCPACGQTWANYKSILGKWEAERPGLVRLVTKDYPLEPECNVNVPKVVHEAACEGAVAVRLARLKKRDEAMEEWLYRNQSAMTPTSVRQAARDVGQITDFDAQYPKTLDLVRFDVSLGKQLGVSRTPTFFINGVKVEGGLPPRYFDEAIALELRKAGK